MLSSHTDGTEDALQAITERLASGMDRLLVALAEQGTHRLSLLEFPAESEQEVSTCVICQTEPAVGRAWLWSGMVPQRYFFFLKEHKRPNLAG